MKTRKNQPSTESLLFVSFASSFQFGWFARGAIQQNSEKVPVLFALESCGRFAVCSSPQLHKLVIVSFRLNLESNVAETL